MKNIFIGHINREIIATLQKEKGIHIPLKHLEELRKTEKEIISNHLRNGDRVYFNGMFSLVRKPAKFVTSENLSENGNIRKTKYKLRTKITPMSHLKSKVDVFIDKEEYEKIKK